MSLRKKIKRQLQNLALRWRWHKVSQGNRPVSPPQRGGLDLCDVFYINLEHRTERRAHIEAEFAKLDLTRFTRVRATLDDNGALGCAKSHLGVLRSWVPTADRLLMICEDDCTFLLDRKALDHLINTFASDPRIDVLCLAFNARNGVSVTREFAITSDTQTTSCYIAKPHVIDELTLSAEKSVTSLAQGLPEQKAAIDVVWKEVQRDVCFAIPNKRAAIQYESYSDVQKTQTSYNV